MISIRTRLIFYMSMLVIIVGAVSCVFFLIYSKKQQEESLKKLGGSLVMLLAQDNEVKDALSYSQRAFLDTPIHVVNELDIEKEIGYLRVATNQSILVEERAPWIDIDMEEIPICKDSGITNVPVLNQAWTRGGVRVVELHPNSNISFGNRKIVCAGEVFYDFTVPVIGKQTFSEEEFAAQILGEAKVSDKTIQENLGFVQIGLSACKLNERVKKIIWRIIIPMGLIIIF